MSQPQTLAGSLFEQPAYLRVAAAALDAEVEVAESAGAMLALLACPDGIRRTAPGMPRPFGRNLPASLGELARDLTEPDVLMSAALSPLDWGTELARQLSVRGGLLASERQICIAELGWDTSRDLLRATPGSAAARELECLTTSEVTTLDEWFAEFVRTAVAFEPGPEHGSVFPDRDGAHFAALATLDHFVIAVHDRFGLAAAALFLHDSREAYLHAGGSRAIPDPGAAIAQVALAAALREASRLGCGIAVLGGGLTDRRDDPLLGLKLELATTSLPSFSIEVGPGFE